MKVGITGISLGIIRTKCRFIPKKFVSRIRSCLRDLGFSFDWCFRIQYFFFFFLQSLFGAVKKFTWNSVQVCFKNGLASCLKPLDLIGKASSFFCVWRFRNTFKWKICNYQHDVCKMKMSEELKRSIYKNTV